MKRLTFPLGRGTLGAVAPLQKLLKPARLPLGPPFLGLAALTAWGAGWLQAQLIDQPLEHGETRCGRVTSALGHTGPMTSSRLGVYLLRLRRQPVSRTLRDLASPRRLVRGLRRLAGPVEDQSNPYLPSISLDEEIRFAVELARCPEKTIRRYVDEIE